MKKLAAMTFAAFSIAAFAKTSTPEGWMDDYDAALKKAAAENKHIIIDFSGSDWCGWCKRLDKEVFDTDAFRKGAKDKYVLLMIDSPNDPSLITEKAQKQNPKLVDKFGINGFPTVVVLNPKGEEVVRLGYERGGPEKYLEKLDAEITLGPEIKKFIDPIEKILSRHDDDMQKDMEDCQRKAAEYAKSLMFKDVCPKYIPLYEKAFAEAKAMKVPENLEARKKELIEEQERRFGQLKKAAEEYAKDKKSKK